MGHRPLDNGAGVHRRGLRKRHSFSLGLHDTIFQAKICTIKGFKMENRTTHYIGRNIYFLSVSQVDIKALEVSLIPN